MDDAMEAMAKAAEQTEKRLLKDLASKDTTSEAVGTLLSQYRALCETLIFLDFEQSKEVETNLWVTHTKAKKRFEKLLRQVRSEDAKRKPVERRKTEKSFLDFIKSSSRFYRGYINRLASHFADVPDILEVAGRLHLETLSADDLVQPSPKVKDLLKDSCHSTLIRLGDLSRWRETGLQTKERNWGPARGYYDLAIFVDPTSGASYNQLAVIAGADEDHLRTMYCLYRALTVERPFPNARANLSKEFEKILKSHEEGRLLATNVTGNEMTGLRVWLLIYHAKCFGQEEFQERRALEDEIFSQLTVDLKQRIPESTLNKYVLMNIAADYVAQQPMTDKQGAMAHESVRLVRSFNVESFVRLLLVLNAELSQHAGQETLDSGSAFLQAPATKLTPVMRKTLPALRHYSSWLLSSFFQWPTATARTQLRRFWEVYVETMNTLLATFDSIQRLPKIDYMLAEDADTAYFEPFKADLVSRRFRQVDNTLKPKSDGPGVKKLDPDEEMLARVLDLVVDALSLYNAKPDFPPGTVPLDIVVVGGKQRFQALEPQARAPNQLSDPHIGDFIDQAAGSQQLDGSITPPFQVQRRPDEHFSPKGSAALHVAAAATYTSLQNQPLTVKDIVQRMQQSPSSPRGSNETRGEAMEAKALHVRQTTTVPLPAMPDESVESQRRLPRDGQLPDVESTPVPLSSGSMFHHEITRQQHLIQQQATPAQTTVQPSSWASATQSSQPKRASIQFASSLWWTESPTRTQGSPEFGYEVPRKSPQPALYGAIGQTPPSAQIN